MSRPMVVVNRHGEGTGRTSSETRRSPPTSKFNPHYHSRDDFYASQQKIHSAQGTTTSQPRSASLEQWAANRPPSAGVPKQQFKPNLLKPLQPNVATINPIKPDTMVIGMALGSPSDYPLPPVGTALSSPHDNPLPQLPKEAQYVNSNLNPKSPYTRTALPLEGSRKSQEDTKHKGGWRMFGNLFSRTPAPSSPVSPSYDLQRPSPLSQSRDPTSPHPRITITGTTEQSRQQQHLKQDNSLAREGNKRNLLSKKRKAETRPGMQRSGTVPQYRSEKRTPSPRPVQHRTEYNPSTLQRPQPNIKPTLLLVDIPHVSMERYSVMFSDVLKPMQPRQSLLVRRQGQLKELNTASIAKNQSYDPTPDNTVLLPTRPATSPSHQPHSPSFSLFPSSKSAKRLPSPLFLNKATTLHRTATAPPGSVSPARAAFELPKAAAQINVAQFVPPSTSARSSEASNSAQTSKWSSHSESTQPSPISDSESNGRKRDVSLVERKPSQFTPSRPALVPTYPKVAAVHGALRDTKLIQRTKSPLDDVARDILLASHPQRTTSTSQPSSTTTVPTPTPINPPHPRHPSPNRYIHHPFTTASPTVIPANYAKRNPLSSSPPSADEISIARQISVSRRQKTQVVPIAQRATVPRTVRQPVVATFVEVDRDGREVGKGHVSRKSHHVLVETV